MLNERSEKALASLDQIEDRAKEIAQEAVGLAPAVKYWDERSELMAEESKSWLKRFWVGSLLLACFVVWRPFIGPTPDPGESGFANSATTLIVCSGAALWALRHSMRMSLFLRGCSADAKHRSAMITTYVSLVDQGKMNTDEDKAIVLKPVFSSLNIDIARDEAQPPHVDIINKTIERRMDS